MSGPPGEDDGNEFNFSLPSSERAEELKGKFVPENTQRGTDYSVRALARFIVNGDYKDRYFNTEPHLRSLFLGNKAAVVEFELSQLKKLLFENCVPDECVPVTQQKRINHFLIEFAVNYRSAKQKKAVTPKTMKFYICGIQRAFEAWGFKMNLFSGPVFADKNDGLLCVLDNLFAEQQANGVTVKGHNVLPREDIKTLLTSNSCSASTPAGYLNRLVLIIGISLGIRTTAMWKLRVSQFEYIRAKGKSVIQFTEIVGSKEGASKTRRGGLRAITKKAVKIYIWNRDMLDGTLNVYEHIHSYLETRKSMEMKTEHADRFFLQINTKGKTLSDFFCKQVIGKNSFGKIIPNLCDEVGIQGTGFNDCVTTHCLRGTMITLLLEAGHSDTTVMLRSGHAQVESVLSYTNLQGDKGLQQQMDIFKDTKPVVDVNEPKEKKQKKMEPTTESKENIKGELALKSAIQTSQGEQSPPVRSQSGIGSSSMSGFENVNANSINVTINHNYQ